MRIFCTFTHSYKNNKLYQKEEEISVVPSLIVYDTNNMKVDIVNYIFPRSTKDFNKIIDAVDFFYGVKPLKNYVFKKLPKFGMTGIREYNNNIYTATWNSIYEINKETLRTKRLISNNLMCDTHGFWIDKNYIITCITGLDTIVFSDHNGIPQKSFSIDRYLKAKDNFNEINKKDWRFVTKQIRGSCGYFHINNIQIVNNKLYLTARNISSFIVVDLENLEDISLKTINFTEPVLIHDGNYIDGKFYFTSINGSIIECLESTNKKDLFNRDLQSKIHKTYVVDEDNSIIRKPTWARGLAKYGRDLYMTVDGRYKDEKGFSLAKFNLDTFNPQIVFSTKNLYDPKIRDSLSSSTGFGILIID